MWSRFFDADGTPRDPALWLVMAGVVASLLLAFWVVCVHQVERAQVRHAEARLAAPSECVPGASGAARCDLQSSATASLPMGSPVR